METREYLPSFSVYSVYSVVKNPWLNPSPLVSVC